MFTVVVECCFRLVNPICETPPPSEEMFTVVVECCFRLVYPICETPPPSEEMFTVVVECCFRLVNPICETLKPMSFAVLSLAICRSIGPNKLDGNLKVRDRSQSGGCRELFPRHNSSCSHFTYSLAWVVVLSCRRITLSVKRLGLFLRTVSLSFLRVPKYFAALMVFDRV